MSTNILQYCRDKKSGKVKSQKVIIFRVPDRGAWRDVEAMC